MSNDFNGPPNRNFGNRNGNQNNFGNAFSNDRFEQLNQSTNSNFYDDFDFNELTRDIGNLDRPGNRNFNTRKNFQCNDDNFGNPNMNFNNQKQFNPRGGNMNLFGGNGNGGGGSGSGGGNSNNRFNDNRNFQNQDDQGSGQHCIHMRGLPYYTDEMDVFNVSFSLNFNLKEPFRLTERALCLQTLLLISFCFF